MKPAALDHYTYDVIARRESPRQSMLRLIHQPGPETLALELPRIRSQ